MSAASLVGTGITLGVVHVVTGPDHLSALATLTAATHWKQSFWLGVRWGLGHSSGLLLVGIVLIRISSTTSTIEVPQQVTIAFESLVGVFMLCLGFYGLVRAYRHRSAQESSEAEYTPNLLLTKNTTGSASLSMADVGSLNSPISQAASSSDTDDDLEQEVAHYKPTLNASIHRQQQQQLEESEDKKKRYCNCTTGCLALSAGVVHGLAGPGGVLGVIPAVQIHNPGLATLYLTTFCLSSTVTMGCFAALYGFVSKKVAQWSHYEFYVQCASALLSIIVGVLWLVLLGLGKLEDIFG